jgi:dTDP-4-dehydrorhamnose 3,5-epimerase
LFVITDVVIVALGVFKDSRGAFESVWEEHNPLPLGTGFAPSSVNFSYNTRKGTLRGLHFQQRPYGQSKLVTCVSGKLLDVVVDLRVESSTYKQWISFELSARSGEALYIPSGCAHGFLSLEDNTTLCYLNEGRYMPDQSQSLRWDDPEIAIDWPINNPTMSEKDKHAPRLFEL